MITDKDIAASERVGLSPVYFAAQRVAEKHLGPQHFMDAEHAVNQLMKPIVDELKQKMFDELTSDFEYGLGETVKVMVEQTVTALLQGQKWALDHYLTGDQASEYTRTRIIKANLELVRTKRIKDLEEEIERLQKQIEYLRNRY